VPIPSEPLPTQRFYSSLFLRVVIVCRFASSFGQNVAPQDLNHGHGFHGQSHTGEVGEIRENPVPVITCASFACLPKRSRQRFLKMIHTFTKDLFIREKVWSKMNDYERVLLKLIAKEICMQPTLIRSVIYEKSLTVHWSHKYV
jgi:hypothetical protein